jgi:hypothetical protein
MAEISSSSKVESSNTKLNISNEDEKKKHTTENEEHNTGTLYPIGFKLLGNQRL